MRSWLFINGSNARQLDKAPMVGADALVVDSEPVPTGEDGEKTRADIAEWFAAHRNQVVASNRFSRWLRIKPLDNPYWREDLVTAMAGAPDGIVIPKAIGPDQIRQLGSEIYELEQRWGIAHNSTRIIAQIGDTALGALTMRDFLDDPHPRLAALTWNAGDLARSLGASRTRQDDGNWCDTLAQVRGTTVLLAKAMGLQAIETPAVDSADIEEGGGAALAAKQDGFTGMGVSHPRHVAIINRIFRPSEEEFADAKTVVGLFASNPHAATISHEGQTLHKSALEKAKNLLALTSV